MHVLSERKHTYQGETKKSDEREGRHNVKSIIPMGSYGADDVLPYIYKATYPTTLNKL